MLRHIEDGGVDLGSAVEEVAEGKSLPCSGCCNWPSGFEGVASPILVIVIVIVIVSRCRMAALRQHL